MTMMLLSVRTAVHPFEKLLQKGTVHKVNALDLVKDALRKMNVLGFHMEEQ